MDMKRFIYWQDDEQWLGYFEEYPDYWTQGSSFEDLQDHLKDLYKDLIGGDVPGIRRAAELEVS